ncbi:putative GNAT family acetyltransferase, partial [Elsinoe ampelina]
FALPLDYSRLETERLRLEPIEHDLPLFASEQAQVIAQQPALLQYVSSPSDDDTVDMLQYWKDRMSSPREQAFAILLKAGTVVKKDAITGEKHEFHVDQDTFAGLTGLIEAKPEWASVEVAHLFILPRFQRTFVATTANALLLKHLLDPVPEDLGLRRVKWEAHSQNAPSIALAKRLGFQQEGIIRWERTIRPGRAGEVVAGMPTEDRAGNTVGPGRHTLVFGLCWDDWRDGGRAKILSLIQ